MKNALKCFTALTATALAVSAAAAARAETPASSNDATTVQELVVTGTAAGSGRAKLDAGFSVTSISPVELQELSPKSTGEVLNNVPGVWVESSGGVGTSNVFVRGIPSTGDAPFVTVQVNGVPVYGASGLSFMDQTALFRLDETVQRVEGVNGGPGSVFSDGQPGLTTNFTLKEGGEETHGELMVTGTTYDQRRVDAVLSGKLTDDTYYMVGGYVTDGPGVRDAGFDTEQGKQITANITHKFEGGKFNLFARLTDDHGEWYVPFATGVPGLNLGTYNPLNNYTRYATIQTVGGGTRNIDLGDGRGWKGVVAGGSLEYDLGGGFEFRDRFGVTDGDLNTYGLLAHGGAVTVGSVLAANPGLGSISTVHGGNVLPTSAYVQDYGAWMALKHLNYVSNEMSVSKTIANNQLTAGYYFSNFSSDDNWSLGNDRAVEVGGSGDLVTATAEQLGGTSNAFYKIKESGTAHVNAFYLADSWNVTSKLRLDAAIREELQHTNFVVTGDSKGAASIDRSAFSWTVGANYKLTSTSDVYVRASEGHHFPSFDDVRNQVAGPIAVSQDENWRVYSYEGGYKFHNHVVDADISLFYDDVNGVVYHDEGSSIPAVVAGSKTYGVEFDGRWNVWGGFSIETNDVWEHPETSDPTGPSIDGKRAERIPEYQVRITPAYKFEVGEAHANLYGTFFAVGQRYSDLQNTEDLPAYQTISAGLLVDWRHLTFKLAGDNLTDSHGLTEGDPRTLPGALSLPNSRPIFGRSATFSVGWKF